MERSRSLSERGEHGLSIFCASFGLSFTLQAHTALSDRSPLHTEMVRATLERRSADDMWARRANRNKEP